MEGVLLTGAYGAGKTTLCSEMADQLDATGTSYAAIDLDWLFWFDVPGLSRRDAEEILIGNLVDVVARYRRAGVSRFILAGRVEQDLFVRMGAALELPLQVVHVEVDLTTIRSRLETAVTSGRADDLEAASHQVHQSHTLPRPDHVVVTDKPAPELAASLLTTLGWGQAQRAG